MNKIKFIGHARQSLYIVPNRETLPIVRPVGRESKGFEYKLSVEPFLPLNISVSAGSLIFSIALVGVAEDRGGSFLGL